MPTDTIRLDELLGQLAEYVGDSKDKAREVALKILDKDETKPVGEVLLKKGLGQRTAAAQDKATEVEARLTKLKDELEEKTQRITELDTELAELRGKEPNWQRRIEEAERKWQTKVDEAKKEADAERSARLSDAVTVERGKFLAALRLGQDGGVEREFGQMLPTHYADHFVPDAQTRTVKVRELGESNTFYDPAEGEPAEQLARDVIAKLPPKFQIVGDPTPGGGTKGGATKPVTVTTEQVVDLKARTGAYQL